MKIWSVLAGALLMSTTNALGTPADLVCSGGSSDDLVKFEIPLITGHSSIYESGVAPMAAHHVNLHIWQDSVRTEIEIFGEHMVGQWMLDGRVDLRFYLEEANEQGDITSYDLITRTKATGQMNSESGQKVHAGQYVFRAYSGSFREGTHEIFIELTGQVACK